MIEWIPIAISGLALAVALGVRLHSLATVEERVSLFEKKLNGMPKDVEQHQREIEDLRDWKHTVATPMFARIQLAELEVTHLKEKFEWKQEIADLRRQVEHRRS